MLEATAMDIAAAFRAKQAGRRGEVDLRRGALRLTDDALAELRGHVEQLAARFADPGADGTWTGVVLAMVDLQDSPGCRSPATEPSVNDVTAQHARVAVRASDAEREQTVALLQRWLQAPSPPVLGRQLRS